MLTKQIELERDMIRLGTDKYLSSVDLKNDFDGTHTQTVIKEIIEPFSHIIDDNIKLLIDKKIRGKKPALLSLMNCVCVSNQNKTNKSISTLQLSYILCRAIFSTIRHSPHKIASTGMNVGRTIKMNIVDSEKLSDGQYFNIGIVLLEMFCSTYDSLLCVKYDYFDRDDSYKCYFIEPSVEYMEYIDQKIDAISDITNIMFPMIHTPCDWTTSGNDGGFYSEQLKSNIIKRKNLSDDPKINGTIVRGVNAIQSTPWSVDQYVYDTFMSLNKVRPDTLKKVYPVPVPEDDERPFDIKYSDMDDDQKKIHQVWSRQCRRNAKLREAKSSIDIGRVSAIRQAKQFAGDNIYFPHDLDYRGRIYNKCMTGLNTQGSDVQKGLIQMQSNRPVSTKSGVRWMQINLANLAGHDKLLLDERQKWTISNEDLLRDIVKDPILCDVWHSWDKPLQGLSACREYVKWLDNPETPLNTHVQLDGLCNGIQNLAALTRDEKVAPHVGLIWTPERGDVYQYVCNGVVDHIKGSGQFADEWLSSELMTRSLSKTPVMTRSYGAKLYGIKEGVQDFIEDNGKTDHFVDYFKAGNWMGERIWESMDESLKQPMAFMEWVQKCAEIMGKANMPLIWNSPVGMQCVQSPKVMKKKRIEVMVNGNRIQYVLQTPTNKINVSKMSSSSSPNIIHSCDASHLMLTVDKCLADGITQFAMVHDSFGCHPDDAEKLLLNAKKAWVEIYSKNWLEIWYESWCNQLGTNDLPKPKEFVTIGSLDIRDVIKSDFFFA